MTTYTGKQYDQGVGGQTVLRDGVPLSPGPSRQLWNHSPDGFNWGYGGSGPAQLALALLLDVTHDEELSVRLHQRFKWSMVAKLGPDWELTSDLIKAWVKEELERELWRGGTLAWPTR